MQIAIVGAGYSGGEADQLRRDMAAWKKHGKLLTHRPRLLEGFARRGIAPEFGAALFEQIKGFGDYGFPESHAASFALLVYASAWLKRYYPAHFAMALLNSQPMGFYPPAGLVRDAKQHGVPVRDVCVLQSRAESSLEPPGEASGIESHAPGARRALRLGLEIVKGLGARTVARIEQVRQERRFADLQDLVRRAGLRRDELEALAAAGALEALAAGRRNALWKARAPRAAGLFANTRSCEPEVALPALCPAEQLVLDYQHKGLCLNDHPLRHLRPRLRRRRVATAAELARAEAGARMGVAGLVTCRQRPSTARGVVFLTLEDETGVANLIVYPRVFARYRLPARHATLLLARGRVERDPAGSVVHLIVRSLARLDGAEPRLSVAVRDFR